MDSAMPFRRRMRWGRGRRPKLRYIYFSPTKKFFIPMNAIPQGYEGVEQIVILPDELEACRLVYLEGKSQSEAAKMMGISRGTLWRLLEAGRRKIVHAVVHNCILVVEGSG